MTDTASAARYYTEQLGFYIVTMPAGTKGPTGMGWNKPERALSDPNEAEQYYTENPTHNMGVLLGASRIVTLDIDHVENTKHIFAALGIDYDAIIGSAPRIVGRPDRAKVVFRAPHDQLKTHKVSWPTPDDPRRTEVVFELRAGAVQDVLPPSIHPETQRPYEWAGTSLDNIPPIPDQLLTIWQDWDRFRPQLQSLCPWAAPPKPPKAKRQVSKDTTSVIDAYNAANSIHELLERHGYKRTAPNRYLSPNSSSGLAGVIVFDDERAFSHHASDPFDSAHTFDAFDLFCHYDHMGDTTKAVKEAAELLNIVSEPEYEYDEEAIQHGAEVAASILPSRRAQKDDDGVPWHLRSIPGTLGRAVDLYNTTAIKDQPLFAVQCAIALAATAMGRRWKTTMRNFPSLYFLNIGPTGCGKEHVKYVIEKVLEEAGQDHLIGPQGYTSASGVFSALINQPSHITIMDEFGRQLKSAGAKGNQHKVDSLTSMMEVYGRLNGTLRPQGFSKMGMTKTQAEEFDKVVKHPALTVMGMSTPEEFYTAISGGDVASGLLNRFIIVRTDTGAQLSKDAGDHDPSADLVEWVREHATAVGSTGNLSEANDTHDRPPEPVVLSFDSEARALLRQYEEDIVKRQNENTSDVLSAMLNRCREIAMRLSLIVARSLRRNEIDAEAMQWAIDYVSFHSDRAIQMFRDNMSDGAFEAACKAVLVKVRASGLRGVTARDLSRSVASFANLTKRQRGEVLEVLQEDYGIQGRNLNEGKPGRPRLAWFVPPDEG